MTFDESTGAGQILSAAPYAVVVADERGSIAYANMEAERLFGWPRPELIGQSIDVLVPSHLRDAHAERRRAYGEHPRVRPMGSVSEISGARRDGSVFPADIMLSPLIVEGQRYVLGMVRDDTARRAGERRLAQLGDDLAGKNVELEARNRELEAFAFSASHDLQEPLRKIVAFGDRLAHRLGDGMDSTATDHLARILDASKRMQNLLEDLLTWSRVSRRAAQSTRVDLDTLIAETLRDLEVALERSGGRVDVGPLGAVDGDPTQLRILFQNLLDNALKYRRKDVPPVVEVRAERPETGGLRLTFRDNGIGFDEKYRDRIFEMFERLHARRDYEGTGIGLALCRRIAEHHGGTIVASSTLGSGSTFVVALSRRWASPQESP